MECGSFGGSCYGGGGAASAAAPRKSMRGGWRKGVTIDLDN